MVLDKEKVEDAVLFAGEHFSEAVYQKYLAGDLSQDELQEIYNLVSRWMAESEQLLKMLH